MVSRIWENATNRFSIRNKHTSQSITINTVKSANPSQAKAPSGAISAPAIISTKSNSNKVKMKLAWTFCKVSSTLSNSTKNKKLSKITYNEDTQTLISSLRYFFIIILDTLKKIPGICFPCIPWKRNSVLCEDKSYSY